MRRSRKFLTIGTSLLTMAVFTFTACHKANDSSSSVPEETGLASDNSTTEKTYDDVQSIADEASNTGSVADLRVAPSILSGCATVTRDTVSVPHKVTIDFGSANCLCRDGINRRGQIIVSYSGHYKDSGSMHSITFSNYFVDDNQVTGTKTVQNMGTNASGQPYFNISVNGSIILANNNGTISNTSTRVRTWTQGYNTAAWNDDVYSVTGSGSITRANGNVFTMSITSPLIIALNCRWIEQGTLQITPPNGNIRTLDYGNGICDAMATYTVNGHTYNVVLH
ncbi:hypothetical protein ACTHGU_11100 [Chitinophagaceae bacterium MMS25-I14]